MQPIDGEALSFALDGTLPEGTELQGIFGALARVDAAIAPDQVLELACPDAPADDRQLALWLETHAPLAPSALVWTRPFTRASDERQVVALARKEWLARQCQRFEAASRVPVRPVVAGTQVPFRIGSPLARTRWLTTMLVAALSLAVAGAALTQPDRVPQGEDSAPLPPDTEAARLFAGPGFAKTLGAALAALPPQASLAALASPANGRLQVELLTRDPDQLRRQVQALPFARAFAEAGQVRQPDMAFRVTYRANGGATVAPSGVSRRAVPLAAASAAKALDALRQQTEAKALASKLSLRLLPDARQSAGTVRLRIEAAGPQEAVLAFAQALESAPPAARLAAWRLDADPAGLRLGGELVAPWTVRP